MYFKALAFSSSLLQATLPDSNTNINTNTSSGMSSSTNSNSHSSHRRKWLTSYLCKPLLLSVFLLYMKRTNTQILWDNDIQDIQSITVVYDRNQELSCRLLLLLQRDPLFIEQLKNTIEFPEQLLSKAHLDMPFAFSIIRNVVTAEKVLEDSRQMAIAGRNNEQTKTSCRQQETEKEATADQSITMQIEQDDHTASSSSSSSMSNWSLLRPAFQSTFQSFFSPSTWTVLSYPCTLLFWCLQYRDIHYPSECFKEAVTQTNKEKETVNTQWKNETNKSEKRKLERRIRRLRQEMDEWKKEGDVQFSRVKNFEVCISICISIDRWLKERNRKEIRRENKS